MTSHNKHTLTIVLMSAVLMIAVLVSAAKASADETIRSESWATVATEIGPHSHIRLSCPKGMHGVGSDVAAMRPFALTSSRRVDGGEAIVWSLHGSAVAYGKPSQTYGLSSVAFKSFNRTVNVEVICE